MNHNNAASNYIAKEIESNLEKKTKAREVYIVIDIMNRLQSIKEPVVIKKLI